MTRQPIRRNVEFKKPGRTRGLVQKFERTFLSSALLNYFISTSGKLFLSALIWPRFIAPHRWHLTRYPMPLANLHPVFHGFKILQLTDLHVGKTRLDYLERVFDATMGEKPDLVAITGDLIDYHPHALPQIDRLLKHLVRLPHKPEGGIVAIFGNHDYNEYSWRHVGPRGRRRRLQKDLVRIVQDSGITLLRNEQHIVTRPDGQGGTAKLPLVGLDEMWTALADPHAAFDGLSVHDPVICLQHNPDGVEFLKPFPWQWMLCGHSHGGQALFPGVGALYVPMEHRHYLQGFFPFDPLPGSPPSLRQRTMFVSRGLGYSTPIRLRCRPEATMFTLQVAT